jgi:hypothetical protein
LDCLSILVDADSPEEVVGIRARAVDASGAPVSDLGVRFEIHGDGSFDETQLVIELTGTTDSEGCAYVTWFQFPQSGPPRNLDCLVCGTLGGDGSIKLERWAHVVQEKAAVIK